MGKESVVIIEGLSKEYKGDVIALEDVSLSVPKNSIYGLLGSNGAGKSTLIHILIGLLKYNKGNVFILEENMKDPSSSLKRRVSIVPQKLSLYLDLNIYDNLYFFGKTYGIKRKELKKRIKELSDIFKLGNLRRKIKHLSGGYQRRVSIAVALLGDPELIILDEALVGIDIETKNIIVDLLLKLKKDKTIIITTHSIKEAEKLCDRICFLHRGKKLIEGKTRDIIKEYSRGEEVFIEITTDSPERAKKILKRMEKLDVKKEVKEEMIIISFLSGEYDLLALMAYIKKAIGKELYIVQDIEIKTPGLEEVVVKLMRS